MNMSKLERRNSSLDIIRIVAVFTVVSVHFFLHNGFYSETISGYGPLEGLLSYFNTGNSADLHSTLMFIMILMRTLFGVCVPLFMILTGYLMSKKTISRSYYKGIVKTLIIFVLASVACMFFKSIHDNQMAKQAFYSAEFGRMFELIKENGNFGLKNYLLSIFDFTGANYSWYIEMYIGLFLIAPFLNLAYHKLERKKHKQLLVATAVFLTVIPTVFNIFNFDTASWWLTPTENDTYQKLIPSFWMGMYPVAYYFVGAYIREFGIKLKTKTLMIVFVVSLFLIGSFSFYRSFGSTFQSSSYVYWYGFGPFLLSTMLFILLSRIKTDNWNHRVKHVLWQVSDLALGIYLMSFVSDSLIYPILKEKVPVMVDRLPYYFITVPLSFIFAAILSVILNGLEMIIMTAYEKIREFVRKQKKENCAKKWQDILFIILLAGGLIFAFWKCRFGFGGNDEAFYLTIPQRLAMGDSLFSDEWHLSQLSSILILPFYWLYTAIARTTEGIMLAARIVYIIFHGAACVLIYSRIRKFGYLSVFASVLYFIYTPYDIMALSYDTMGLELVTLTGVLIGTADYSKKLSIIFSGLTFAGAVLCCPYLAAGYILFAICVVLHILLRKKDCKLFLKSDMFSLRTFLFFTLGAGALAVIFLVFVFTRVSIGQIFENLPLMMTDPEHPHIAFVTKIDSYFNAIFTFHGNQIFKYFAICYGIMLVVMLLDRKRRTHRSVYLIITTAIVILSEILLVPNLHDSTYNAIMFPPVFVGITSYILCKNKPKELFAGLFVLGILYSFCIHCSSNQYFYVISMAFTATNMGSFLFLARLIREMQTSPDNITYAVWIKRFCYAFVALMIFLQGAFQIGSKARHVFWDGEPSSLTSEITAGPAKGIYTTAANQNSYEQIYDDILTNYENAEKDNILFLTNKTWTYLAAEDFPYGTFSAWLSGERYSSLNRLDMYYEQNPEKLPKYIYIPKDSEWDINYVLSWAAQKGYTYSENSVSYQLVTAN